MYATEVIMTGLFPRNKNDMTPLSWACLRLAIRLTYSRGYYPYGGTITLTVILYCIYRKGKLKLSESDQGLICDCDIDDAVA
jgi:hypothetical protein